MPAGSPASSTRERLIQASHDLFYDQGFHSVGLDRILDVVGVTKTTFYNHFESKDDLVLEALRWHDKWWQETFRKMLRVHGGDTPRGQLLAVPDVVKELITNKGFKGCIFINVAVEFPLPHDPVHKLAHEHKDSMEDILREIAGYAGAGDPKTLAEEIAMVMEGSYVTMQITHRDSTSEVARRIIGQIVEHHIPA